MCFSVGCLSMDESCFHGSFLARSTTPPQYTANFHFINNILHKNVVLFINPFVIVLKVKLVGNNYLTLVYSCIWKM